MKIALAGGLALGSLALTPAPAVAQRVWVTAGGGVADIRGGGLVPGNREPVIVGRMTFDVTRWIGLDVEGSVTGESMSRVHYRRAGYSGFYAPYDLWVFGVGVDVALGPRRLAIVPEVRTLVPYTLAGGRFDGGVHTRAAIGMRAGF